MNTPEAQAKLAEKILKNHVVYKTSRKTFSSDIADALIRFAEKRGCHSFYPKWIDEDAYRNCDFYICAHKYEYDELMRFARELEK